MAKFYREAFLETLDVTRSARGKSWKDVARESEVSPSSLSRLSRGKSVTMETFSKLVDWMGLSADLFIQRQRSSVDGPEAVIVERLTNDYRLRPEVRQVLVDSVKSAYSAIGSSADQELVEVSRLGGSGSLSEGVR